MFKFRSVLVMVFLILLTSCTVSEPTGDSNSIEATRVSVFQTLRNMPLFPDSQTWRGSHKAATVVRRLFCLQSRPSFVVLIIELYDDAVVSLPAYTFKV